MSELKPCPFCGRTDLLGIETVARGFLSVVCRSCGASRGGGRAETDTEAIEAWNRRTQPAQVPTCKTCGRSMNDPVVNHGANGCCPAQVPMSTEQQVDAMHQSQATEKFGATFLAGIRAAERHHGIAS